MSLSRLQQRAKEFTTLLPFMEGREKSDLKDLHNKPVTIREYGFLKDDEGKSYVVFIIDEDPANFYFGGMVLTENLTDLDNDGLHADVNKEGLKVLMSEKTSKNKKTYTSVEYIVDEAKTK